MRNIPKYFRVEPSDDTLILSAVGSIDMLLDEEVREECDLLVEQLSHHNATNLVIDLGAVGPLRLGDVRVDGNPVETHQDRHAKVRRL